MVHLVVTAAAVALATRISVPLIIEFETGGGILPVEVSYGPHQPERGTFGGPYPADLMIQSLDGDPVVRVETTERAVAGFGYRLIADLPPYDATLTLDFRDKYGPSGVAVWTKARTQGDAVVAGKTRRRADGDIYGFAPLELEDEVADADFTGRWRVKFASSEDEAVGVFAGSDGPAGGTFLTTTGDYRKLRGRADGNLMRLATFDGAHGFLFHAEMQADGSLAGDFYSGNWYHETWTAVRDEDFQLPDAFSQTVITDPDFGRLSFPDLEGNEQRIGDFLEGPVIIDVFGSWCPNCTDASALLAEYVERYDGLKVLGLAVEFGKDHATNTARVRKHQEHHDADWPVLIASSTIDKTEATKDLGFLDRVRSYPTLIFTNDGVVEAVYSGFSGPATGKAHRKMREDFERIIQGMMKTTKKD